MHDPMIVAHEIKYPWWRNKPWPKKFRHSEDRQFTWKHRMNDKDREGRDSHWEEGYRDTFITIWHVDPEKDGSDDSCGWSWPKLTKEQRERLRNTAWSEAHDPHFLCCAAKEWKGTMAEAEILFRGMVLLVARVLRLKFSYDVLARYAAEAMHIRTGGRAGDVFCFLPGYHTNSQKDSRDDRQEHFAGILYGIARGLLDMKRPWWRHPKWHFWHWKFQCHPLQLFKRWAFSRCSKCGGRMKYGESVVSNSWHGTGPMWFRSEKDVMCEKCSGYLCESTPSMAKNAQYQTP